MELDDIDVETELQMIAACEQVEAEHTSDSSGELISTQSPAAAATDADAASVLEKQRNDAAAAR